MTDSLLHATYLWTLGQQLQGQWIGNVGITTAKAVAVYAAGLLIVRIGSRRMLGRATAFDVVLAFILGSLLSRAINGTGYVVATLVAGCVLVAMHWTVSAVTRRWPWAEAAFKGTHRHLILDGQPQERSMRKAELSDRDLYEALRQAGVESPEQVAMACIERSGKISVIRRHEPRVVDVRVDDGVQTVRIELS